MTYTVQYCVACARLVVSADEWKKQVSSEIVNEWETAGREKDRACNHLFKYMYIYLNPRTTCPISEKPFPVSMICQVSQFQKVQCRRVWQSCCTDVQVR